MYKERNIALCILFTVLTCGIYGIYWFICLTDEANAAAEVQETSGGMAFLFTLITCGIYGLYWTYKQGEKLEYAKSKRGLSSSSSSLGVVYLLLSIFGLVIIAYALMQNELNQLA